MNTLKQRKAFTIVEMVIVIAVIAILAAVLIPTISGVIKSATISTDKQFVANLNVQLAMWQADPDNGTISSESDLRDAINYFYGDDDELTDFYSNLAPNSAKYGYHFWFDATDKQVVLATFDELEENAAEPATASVFNMMDGIQLIGEQDPSQGAEGSTDVVKPSFDAASPRSIMIGGKNYFLMDQDGSELITNLKAVENVDGNAAYGTAVTALRATEDETALADVIAARLETIAIANANGVFFYTDWAAATHVHIPYGTTTIGKSNVDASKLTGVTEIYLPDTLTQIGTGSLVGFTANNTNPDTWEGSTTIYANVTEDDVIDGFVASDAFNCVLQLPTGERYAFVGGVLTKLGTGTTFETEYSVELKSFVVSVPSDKDAGDKAVLVFNGTDNKLDIANDYAEGATITLKADTFKDENGNTNRVANWKINNGTAVSGNEFTVNAADLADGTIITVNAQNITYTITVRVVALTSFDLTELDGNPFTADSYNNDDILTLELLYSKDKIAWDLPITENYTPSDARVKPAVAFTIVDSKGYVEYKDGQIVLTEAGKKLTTAVSEYDITIKFNDSIQQTVKITLTNNNAPDFIVNNTVYNLNNYSGLKFVFGNTAPTGGVTTVKLGEIFQNVPADVTMPITFKSSATEEKKFTVGEDWTQFEIVLSNLSATENYVFTLTSSLNIPTTVTVRIVAAQNVTSEAEWKAASGSIVVLRGFSFTYNTLTAESVANAYNKSITNLYGNMYQLDASAMKKTVHNLETARVKIGDASAKNTNENAKNAAKANEALITLSGTAENVILIGGTFPTIHYSSSCLNLLSRLANSNQYFFDGITLSSGAKVKDSYIYGFRAPLRINYAATVENSIFEGGTLANIYIYGDTTGQITLNNVTTIQDSDGGYNSTSGSKIIGAGIYFDTKAKCTLVLDGNTQHYNWVNSADAKEFSTGGSGLTDIGIEDIIPKVLSAAGDDKHNNNDTVNTAILQEKDGQTVTVQCGTNYKGPKYVTDANGNLSSKSIKASTKTFYWWTYAKCSATCSHTITPITSISSNGTDFGVAGYIRYRTPTTSGTGD